MPFIINTPGPTPTGPDTLTAPQIPHFQFPFTMSTQTDGTITATVVEQDSLEEIQACVQAICTCPIGARADLPNFGVPNQLFASAPLDTNAITNAIMFWEPRANAIATEYPDALSDAIRHIQVDVSPQQPSQ